VKLIGMMPVRNEGHVLGLSARAALMWCDELMLLNHASTDETPAILARLDAERAWFQQVSGDWTEMGHRQMLLGWARHRRATHLAIIDADEILTGNALPYIRGWIEDLGPEAVLSLPFFNLRGSLTRYHANGLWGNRGGTVAFPDDPRLHWIGDGHHKREPMGIPLKFTTPDGIQGGVMHLWGNEERRLRAKVRLYRILDHLSGKSELINNPLLALEGHPQIPQFGTPATWTYAETPASWWNAYRHLMHYYKPDVVPWQEAECERILREHPDLLPVKL
jgi:Glycosyl transferase family 2